MKLERVRLVDSAQVQAFADLHVQAFPGFFLSQLGPKFLALLYTHYLQSEQCACILASDDSAGRAPKGLAVAIRQPSLFYKDLFAKHWLAFALRALPSLLKNPLFVAKKLWAAVFYRGDQVESLDAENAVLLSTISVSPQAQGQGVGRQLLQEVEAWAAESGAAFVYLTTDRDANVEVNGFYQRNGYVLESTLKKSGNRIMNRYIKRLR